jgi:hypothetical protein
MSYLAGTIREIDQSAFQEPVADIVKLFNSFTIATSLSFNEQPSGQSQALHQ